MRTDINGYNRLNGAVKNMYYVDRSEITRLLNLTRSSNGQTLEHVKKCNELLKQKKLVWESVVAHIPDKNPEVRDRLIKLMGMTQGTDGEATTAIKMANDTLLKEHLIWNQIFNEELLAIVFPILTNDKPKDKPKIRTHRTTYSRRGLLPSHILYILEKYPDWILKTELVQKVIDEFGHVNGAIYRQITSSKPTQEWVRTGNLIERGIVEQSEDKKYVRLNKNW